MMRKLCLVALLLLSVGVWAQPDPNVPQPDIPGKRGGNRNMPAFQFQGMLRQVSTQLAMTPRGLFVLRNGVLAKYDGRSAQPVGQLELFDAMPPAPADNAPETDWQAYALAQVRRLLPATIAVQDNDLIIATIDQLWSVDSATLKITAKVPLGDAQQQGRMAGMQEPPQVEVFGKTAYLVRGMQLTAVDLTAGKILFDGPLPESMMPKAMEELRRHFQPNGGPGQPGPGKPAAGNMEAKTSIVGVLRHVDLEGGFWTIETKDGLKYVLEGEKLKALIATPNIDGLRVRLTGAITNHPGVAQYGNGYFSITNFETLPRPKPNK